MTVLALGLALALAPPAPPAAVEPAPVAAPAPDEETIGKREREWQAARKQMVTILALLTALSALLMLLGYAAFVRRWGQAVAKRPERLPIKYHDLTIPPEPPPPTELSAEERFGPRPD